MVLAALVDAGIISLHTAISKRLPTIKQQIEPAQPPKRKKKKKTSKKGTVENSKSKKESEEQSEEECSGEDSP